MKARKYSCIIPDFIFFPGKLRSRWTGPYIIKEIFPHGAVEIENAANGNRFKVNGQRLKPFVEKFDSEDTSITLNDPVY